MIISTKKTAVIINWVTAFLLFAVCTAISAQNTNNQTVTGKKYVRVDIGHGALHCPFLSPKLESKMKEIKDINNFFIDKRTSYLTFELPAATGITVDAIKQIGIDVGYPSSDVVVSMDNKPIVPTSTPQ
jgi:hypothetical protein